MERELTGWRRVLGPVFGPFREGDSDTKVETDKEELGELHRVEVELDSDTETEDLQYLVDQVPSTDNPVISLPGSRAHSVVGDLQLVEEQGKNTGVKRKQLPRNIFQPISDCSLLPCSKLVRMLGSLWLFWE